MKNPENPEKQAVKAEISVLSFMRFCQYPVPHFSPQQLGLKPLVVCKKYAHFFVQHPPYRITRGVKLCSPSAFLGLCCI